jgi:hypothetical protein
VPGNLARRAAAMSPAQRLLEFPMPFNNFLSQGVEK